MKFDISKHINFTYGIICIFIAILGISPEIARIHAQNAKIVKQIQVTPTKNGSSAPSNINSTDPSDMRKPINWHKSSEAKPYPNLSKTKHLWVEVSLKNNRTYLYDGDKLIYTMYSTGGMYVKDPQTGKRKSMTPTGTFYVESERGDHFFNQNLGEGANYYVSWLGHGTYLFHSVPTKANGSYNVAEADKLGKSTGSHGCIRLSIPDAQWMSKNLPVGTKVKIVN